MKRQGFAKKADSTRRGDSVAGGIFVGDERLAGSEFDPGSSTYIFGETFTAPPIRSLSPDVAVAP